MKELVLRVGEFVRILRGCLTDAWKDSDCHYHIPKSRFNGNFGEEGEGVPSSPRAPATNYFLGSFRDCVLTAWEASDRDYNIPKSRFMDPDFNRTAYKKSDRVGPVSRVVGFFSNLPESLSAAWEASDIFYHLPKSRYQDADFIRNLMDLAPEPKGKLLYRPYMIGHGVVIGEASGKGWLVERPAGDNGEDTDAETMDDKLKDLPFVMDREQGSGGPEIDV